MGGVGSGRRKGPPKAPVPEVQRQVVQPVNRPAGMPFWPWLGKVLLGIIGVGLAHIVVLLLVSLRISNEFTPVDAQQSELARGLDYLSSRYGETFEFDSGLTSLDEGGVSFFARCSGLSVPVRVTVRDGLTSSPIYSDNYLAVKYRDALVSYLNGLASEVWSDVRVHSDWFSTESTSSLDPDATFDEYLVSGRVEFIGFIEVVSKEGLFRDEVSVFLDKLDGFVGDMDLSVLVVSADTFGSKTLIDLRSEYASGYAGDSCSIAIRFGELSHLGFNDD